MSIIKVNGAISINRIEHCEEKKKRRGAMPQPPVVNNDNFGFPNRVVVRKEKESYGTTETLFT